MGADAVLVNTAIAVGIGKAKEGASDDGSTYILEVTLRNWETTPGEHPCSMTLTLYSNLKSQGGGQTVNWNRHNVIE